VGGFKVEMNKFYVYAYLRCPPSESGIIAHPYYIGKGSRNRINTKARKEVHPPPDLACRQVIADRLDERSAFSLETCLISLYGRKNLGTGCLRNRTDGGDGTSGAAKTTEEKNLRSVMAKKRWADPVMRQRYLDGYNQSWESPQRREETSKRMMGHQHSEETKKKMADRKIGYIPWNKGKTVGRSWNKGKKTGPRLGVPAPRRDEAFRLFKEGLKSRQVSELMGIRLGTAQFYAWRWRKECSKKRRNTCTKTTS
jgi:hypothetical protein